MNNDTKRVKILVKQIELNGKKWTAYRMVGEGGKLIDARFRLGSDTSEIDNCMKCYVTVGYYSDASDRYEYPRVYLADIISVEPIC